MAFAWNCEFILTLFTAIKAGIDYCIILKRRFHFLGRSCLLKGYIVSF